MRKLITLFILFVGTLTFGFAQSAEIQGKVTDKDTEEGIPFANVVVERNGAFVTGATSDFDGFYSIKPITPGSYDVKVSFVGYQPKSINGVVVNDGKITFLDMAIGSSAELLNVVEIVEYKVPLLKEDETSTGSTVTKEDIENLPTRNVNSIASTTAGVYQGDEGGGLSIRGSRGDAVDYYIDGVKVRGSSSLPSTAIEQLTVISGGVPAKYGDAVGGIISITTRGPSRKISGGIEFVTSEFLDPYGYSLASFNLSGPIWKRNKGDLEKERTVLGYFLAGEYLRQEDSDPSALGYWKVKDDVRKALEEDPLRVSNVSIGFEKNADFIDFSDMEKIDAKENALSESYRGVGRLDLRLSDNVNISFGGTFDYTDQSQYVRTYSLLNPQGNNRRRDQTWRVYGRFTQRFGNRYAEEEEEGSKASAFQNAYYSLQIDYTKDKLRVENKELGDKIFDYGWVGTFNTFGTPFYVPDVDNGRQVYVGNFDTLVTFDPGDLSVHPNPEFAKLTQQYFDLSADNRFLTQNINNIELFGGLVNGTRLQSAQRVYEMWFIPGRKVDQFGYGDNDQYRLSANASVDIKKPGSSDRNKHAIELGFEYEQRIDRLWIVNPVGLWPQMRQLTNDHIQDLYLENPVYRFDQYGVFLDTVNYAFNYDEDLHKRFDKSLRNKLGLSETSLEDINVDGLDREIFSLDMFSPDELLNNGRRTSFISYYGYDYTGNKLTEQPTFNSFFQDKDENGDFTRNIGAFRPIYTAGYIQDKFAFKDILFNIGLRVDRYDANQKVLKDQYSLYAIRSVAEVDGSLNQSLGRHPETVGEDFAVYVDNVEDPNDIIGYRIDDAWYNASGQLVDDPNVIASASANGKIEPYLLDPEDDVTEDTFDPDKSFEDYEPQVTLMPRVSFSFPVVEGDEGTRAMFFANYSVLTQRPQSRAFATPESYLFFNEQGVTFNNPNLQPERTIEYQLGFKQKLNRSSAVTLAVFYRELKDNIQITNIPFAWPNNSYLTFGNEDFGTVKGFEFSYDLRRTKNIQLKASYTLQFAEGTGSGTTSQANLAAAGQANLKTIIPLNIDSRHQFSAQVDYRFGSGRDYNGPKLFGGRDFFSNSGINLTLNARSGEPFTRQAQATPTNLAGNSDRANVTGSVNGSRLPWHFRADTRIDKELALKLGGKKEGKKEKELGLSIYVNIQNLLNNRNIVSVYRFTGNPDDDGYLTAPQYQESIADRNCEDCFRDLYEISVNNPGRYSSPRTVRLGTVIRF